MLSVSRHQVTGRVSEILLISGKPVNQPLTFSLEYFLGSFLRRRFILRHLHDASNHFVDRRNDFEHFLRDIIGSVIALDRSFHIDFSMKEERTSHLKENSIDVQLKITEKEIYSMRTWPLSSLHYMDYKCILFRRVYLTFWDIFSTHLSRDVSVAVQVVHGKGPLEFLLQFSPRRHAQRAQKLPEIYRTVAVLIEGPGDFVGG